MPVRDATSSSDRARERGAGAIRATARLIGLTLWTVGCATVWLAGHALGDSDRRVRWRRRRFQGWARGAARILGLRMVLRGSAPPAPFIAVANHLGYVDVLMLAAHTGCRFVAKREVRCWPVWGRLAEWMGTIFIERERPRDSLRALEHIESAVAAGEGVVIFAEGTSGAGDQVLPLKAALLEASRRTGLPVVPVTLAYRTWSSTAPASRVVCWWGAMEFGPHFRRLCSLDGFTGAVWFGRRPVPPADRKVLARDVHRALVRQFIPTCPGGEAWATP